ncbi:MAG: UDP-N-acetylmuramate--L-alanine ligase [Ardenticatenaceae bacterium]|nr:UDP-N-acetylmuramate--L-alanine ligase [Ardenticatenaceae bacterium]
MNAQPQLSQIHLIGIGGAGMSAIARVLLGRGVAVSGSDQQAGSETAALAQLGVKIFIGHDESHIAGAEIIVRSSAVPDQNPEVAAARAQQIPVLKRADFLGRLMTDQTGIAVTGTHGKTTTTGMIAHILLKAELDPTVIIGGTLPLLQGNGHAGAGRHFVIEADEYDRMFLGLKPKIGVVTNVEHDHPDIYPTAASYHAAYRAFVEQLPANGRLITCVDDRGAAQILQLAGPHITTVAYTLNESYDSYGNGHLLRGKNVRANVAGGNNFEVELDGETLGVIELQVPGRHNVQNALAATATALFEGVNFSTIAAALHSFSGMGRRFEIKGSIRGITIIDDYAHHPTEIQATLEAARGRYPRRRIWAVWQPHTFSRTRLFLEAFKHSFGQADRVVVLDIYRSREKETLGVVAADVAQAINHDHACYAQDIDAAVTLLQNQMRSGDIIITMNAGDATIIGDRLLDYLELEKETV